MLVDNKFIYINLPRCASTSFVISSYRRNISLNYYTNYVKPFNETIDINLPNEELADALMHPHEPIHQLEEKFGNTFEIISVRRNRHERFISLWKHILDEVNRTGDTHSFEILRNLNENEIFTFTPNEIAIKDSETTKKVVTEKFINKLGLTEDNPYLTTILSIALTPYSHYHNFDKRIIWFDFNELYKLENWVSNKLEIDFKLEKINSSQHFDCNIKLNENFYKKYNSVFDRFDLQKNNKTIM
jgi:hypothetical protein